MTLGVRGQLFLVSFAIVVCVVSVFGGIAEREIRASLVARIESELLDEARAVRTVVVRAPVAEIDARVDELGAAVSAHVSVIRADGVVLGDSELTPAEVAVAESHAARPEVLAALSRGMGSAVGFSTTLRTDMLYVAVPFQTTETRGVVRTAMPLRAVDDAVARMRALLLVAAALGLLVAVGMSALASELTSRALRELVARTRRLAAGASGAGGDEIEALAGTFQNLSRELDGSVAKLAEERDRTRAVLEGMREAVVAVEEHQRIVLVNGAARALLSIEGDPAGRPLVEVARTPAILDAAARASAGAVAEADLVLGRASLTLRATPTGSGGAVVVLTDVTEVVRLERVRRDFVANVSHELRTPVSVILATAETLQDGGLEDSSRARAFVEAIARHADRLSRLIADLLDLSRIEGGGLELEIRPVSVAEAAGRAIDAVRARAEAKGQRVDVSDALPAVAADAKALDQILVNLLDNAVKYTQAGGRIQVSASVVDDEVLVIVEDDGPGVAAEHRARLFERFYRVDAGRSRGMGGTGLGLAIVKHLAEAMRGTVIVEPAVPHGARFVVRLPRG